MLHERRLPSGLSGSVCLHRVWRKRMLNKIIVFKTGVIQNASMIQCIYMI